MHFPIYHNATIVNIYSTTYKYIHTVLTTFLVASPNFNGELVKVGYERGERFSLKGDILAQVYSTQILQVPPGVY